jgi:uncharacterized membrane protein
MSQKQKPDNNGRLFAILAYIVPVIGGIIGIVVNGDNALTRKHSQQTIGAILTMVVTFLIWVIVGFIIALIPFVGPIAAVCLFALVIAYYILLGVSWIVGLIHAIQGRDMEFPIASRLTKRIFGDVSKRKVVSVQG